MENMKIVYYSDDQYCTLQDVQTIIPDAWIVPAMGEYISEDGATYCKRLPVGVWDIRSLKDALDKIQ